MNTFHAEFPIFWSFDLAHHGLAPPLDTISVISRQSGLQSTLCRWGSSAKNSLILSISTSKSTLLAQWRKSPEWTRMSPSGIDTRCSCLWVSETCTTRITRASVSPTHPTRAYVVFSCRASFLALPCWVFPPKTHHQQHRINTAVSGTVSIHGQIQVQSSDEDRSSPASPFIYHHGQKVESILGMGYGLLPSYTRQKRRYPRLEHAAIAHIPLGRSS